MIRALCFGAALFGVTWLALILFTLFYNGVIGLNLQVFTENTPPPGSTEGGLLNAIIGSVIMTAIGVGIGAPLGLFAGTYLAEYGRNDRLTSVIRFINDILLSAPSIIIGLFIYGAVVVPMGSFSAIAGSLALAVIVIPVVLRTTEDMLLLVPNPLREAASALGLPRSLVIKRIAYRAARSGLITGVLLATARVAGETAPLLFTALSNQFFSLDLTQDDGEPAGDHQQLRAEPLRLLEAARLERGAAHHLDRARAEYRRAHSWRREDAQNERSFCFREYPGRATPCRAAAGGPGQGHRAQPELLLRREPRAEEHQPDARHQSRHRLHRPVRLRQVDVAADLQPDVRPLSGPARGRPA